MWIEFTSTSCKKCRYFGISTCTSCCVKKYIKTSTASVIDAKVFILLRTSTLAPGHDIFSVMFTWFLESSPGIYTQRRYGGVSGCGAYLLGGDADSEVEIPFVVFDTVDRCKQAMRGMIGRHDLVVIRVEVDKHTLTPLGDGMHFTTWLKLLHSV